MDEGNDFDVEIMEHFRAKKENGNPEWYVLGKFMLDSGKSVGLVADANSLFQDSFLRADENKNALLDYAEMLVSKGKEANFVAHVKSFKFTKQIADQLGVDYKGFGQRVKENYPTLFGRTATSGPAAAASGKSASSCSDNCSEEHHTDIEINFKEIDAFKSDFVPGGRFHNATCRVCKSGFGTGENPIKQGKSGLWVCQRYEAKMSYCKQIVCSKCRLEKLTAGSNSRSRRKRNRQN